MMIVMAYIINLIAFIIHPAHEYISQMNMQLKPTTVNMEGATSKNPHRHDRKVESLVIRFFETLCL